MIPLGLTSKQKRILHQLMLGGHHQMRIRVQATNLEGSFVSDLTDYLLDGQVNVDDTAEVTRSASITLLNVGNILDFDSNSPANAALFLDRMIRIWYGVRVDLEDGEGYRWLDIPIFTGPVMSLNRSGDTLAVEAQGKEVLAMGAAWKPLTIRKDTRKTVAIRTILRERAGERNFDIPALTARLPKPITLGRGARPWLRAVAISQSFGGRQLFYDGRGTCRMRRIPGVPIFDFGPGSLLSELEISYTQGETVNAVFVQGGVPAGKKARVTAEVFAAQRHPLSPHRLGRNGVPRYLMELVEDNNIRKASEATRIGRERLRRGLQQAVDASFDVMPIPVFDPRDMVRVVTDEGSVTFRLRTFSIPLTAGQPMSMGYLRNISPRRRPGRGTIGGQWYRSKTWLEPARPATTTVRRKRR